MDHGFRLKFLEDSLDKFPILQITDVAGDLLATNALPDTNTLVQGHDRRQAVGATLHMHPTSQEIIRNCHLVPPVGKMHRRAPTEVAITTQNQDSHSLLPPFVHPQPLQPLPKPLPSCP